MRLRSLALVGLARTAKAMVEKMSHDDEKLVDAYADGISQFNARIAVGDEEMPGGMIGSRIPGTTSTSRASLSRHPVRHPRIQSASRVGRYDPDFDVTDSDEETLTGDGGAVIFKGQNVLIENVRETINIAKGAPLEHDVLVVPHHRPIAPNITPITR